MIVKSPKPPPATDDTAAPVRTTPKRLHAALMARSIAIAAEALRLRHCAAFLPDRSLDRECETLENLARHLADLATAVLVGTLPIVAFLDSDAGRGERPLIDAIEDAGRAWREADTLPADKPAPEPAAALPAPEASKPDRPKPSRPKRERKTAPPAPEPAVDGNPRQSTATAPPPPPVPLWLVYHGPAGGPFERVCAVEAPHYTEAVAAAKARIAWQVYNFPLGLVLLDEHTPYGAKKMARLSADRDWLTGEEWEPLSGAEPVSIRGDGRDQVPAVLPEAPPRMYEASTRVDGRKVVKGSLKAVSHSDAIRIAGRLWPGAGPIAVEPIKAEAAARHDAKRERGKRALDREFERDARRAMYQLEATPGEPDEPEPEAPKRPRGRKARAGALAEAAP